MPAVVRGYRPDIDGLRMVAVVGVVLYHAGLLPLSGGYVGVDVFFVISGFLISSKLLADLEDGSFSIVDFYERRVRRIMPALIAVVAACFVAGVVLLLPEGLERLSKSALATSLFASNLWFWRATTDYFASAADLEPLLHTWTLAVEEQFYILFPLLLWVLARSPRRVLLALMAALTVASLALAAYGSSRHPSASFFLLPTRWWELGLGVVLALGPMPPLAMRWVRESVAMAGFAAILVAFVVFDESTRVPGLAALIPCLGAVALIAAGAQGPSLAGRLLSLGPVVFVGLISYSLYLWHWPVFVFLRIYFDDATLSPTIAVLAVVIAFAAATASWAWVERPFRRRPPRGLRTSTVFASAAVGAAVVAAIAAVILIAEGLPNRFSPEARLAFAGAGDTGPYRDLCLDVWPNSGLCRIGTSVGLESAADFLLWGDSHAATVASGINLAARQRGKSGLVAAKRACPPLLGVERVDMGPGHDCAGFNQAVMSELRARADIPLVILVARWALDAEGSRAPTERGGPALLAWADGSDTGPYDPGRNIEIFRKGLASTIAAIRSTGRSVLILGDVPEIGWNVPRNLGRNLAWGQPLPAAPTLLSHSVRNRRVNEVLAQLAEPSVVRVLDLAPLFCDPVCRTSFQGRPLYFDDDHLSQYGSVRILGPLFAGQVWR